MGAPGPASESKSEGELVDAEEGVVLEREEKGCIRFESRPGLTTWVGSSHLGIIGSSNKVHSLSAGSYRVQQGMQPDRSDATAIDGVEVLPGRVTTVVCAYGQRCRFEVTGDSCD